eukprot:1539986-Amphidinium_carterae.1
MFCRRLLNGEEVVIEDSKPDYFEMLLKYTGFDKGRAVGTTGTRESTNTEEDETPLTPEEHSILRT